MMKWEAEAKGYTCNDCYLSMQNCHDMSNLEYPTDGKYRRDRAWAVGFNAGARHCNEHAVYAKTVIEAEDEE